MTPYLLDRDVMSQLDLTEKARHRNVEHWLRTVPASDLYVAAITVMEAWKGFATMRRRASGRFAALTDCDRYEAAFERLVEAFGDRIVAIDEPVAKAWGSLLGRQDKNRFDACVAATALVHDMVVATRNRRDFMGLGVRVVDPFRNRPTIERPAI